VIDFMDICETNVDGFGRVRVSEILHARAEHLVELKRISWSQSFGTAPDAVQ
jgi:hypothetical protein